MRLRLPLGPFVLELLTLEGGELVAAWYLHRHGCERVLAVLELARA